MDSQNSSPNTNTKRFIFLDIDGVINPFNSLNNQDCEYDEYGPLFNEECIHQLKRILESTGARIVISSSWKEVRNAETDFKRLLDMWQQRNLPGELIDATPNATNLDIRKHNPYKSFCQKKGVEIQLWIEEYESHSRSKCSEYVILDDNDVVIPSQKNHFVQTNSNEGITKDVADKVIQMFSKSLKQKTDKILIIPDVHGRTFWRNAMDFEGEVIFLGDYLDPYPSERISMAGAMSEFQKVIDWAKENPKVHLLLGNHDWHYIYTDFNASRRDDFFWDIAHDMYKNNRSLFHRYWFVGGTLFTHAGLSKGWMKWMLKTDWRDAIENADSVDMFACGPERWGENPVSGPLWLDYEELNPKRSSLYHKDEIWLDDEVKFQIFGHTQQVKTGNIAKGEGWASIDSRAVFEVNPYNPADTLKKFE